MNIELLIQSGIRRGRRTWAIMPVWLLALGAILPSGLFSVSGRPSDGPPLRPVLQIIEDKAAEALAQAVAEKIVAEFEAAMKSTAREAAEKQALAAMKIYGNPDARRILKQAASAKGTPLNKLGRDYRLFMTGGGDGQGGINRQILERAKVILRLDGVEEAVLKELKFIQNTGSVDAPMDADFGIKDLSRKSQFELFGRDLKKVDAFQNKLQKALEQSYLLVAAEHGLTVVDPALAFISGTTSFHAEAYLDVRVLEKGGVAGKDLIEQTTGVSKEKITTIRAKVRAGKITEGFALYEAARGTLKDLDKVKAVFAHLEKITGVKPIWRAGQENTIAGLRLLTEGNIDPFAASRAIYSMTGKSLYEACNDLIDTMENAWKLRKILPQEQLMSFLAGYLASPGEDLDAAFRAVAAGKLDDLPESAKSLVAQLKLLGARRLSSLKAGQGSGIAALILDLKKISPLFALRADDPIVLQFFQMLESGRRSESLAFIFGNEFADRIAEMAKAAQVPGRLRRLTDRFLRGGLTQDALDAQIRELAKFQAEADIKTKGLEGPVKTRKFESADRLGLYSDAFFRTGMYLWQVGEIMDQNLDPAEESRRLDEALYMSIPVVGDFYMGYIMGKEAYKEGDVDKGMKACAWVAIGALALVPGGQIPAMVAGLVLMADDLLAPVVEVLKDMTLIEAWIASGTWDEKQGILLAVVDEKKTAHSLAAGQEPGDLQGNFRRIVLEGDAGYRSKLIRIGDKTDLVRGKPRPLFLTLRESIYDYAERTALARNERVQAMKSGFAKLYPPEDFDLNGLLKEPKAVGREFLDAKIREKMGKSEPSIVILIFNNLKDIYDETALQCVALLKMQAEEEYQARNDIGEVKDLEARLKALGEELRVPLLDRLNASFDGVKKYIERTIEKLKNPRTAAQSLARYRMEMLRRYVKGYTDILKTIGEIGKLFEQADLPKPAQWSLTGILDVDQIRIDNLKTDYLQAFRVARNDARSVRLEAQKAESAPSPASAGTDPCEDALYKKLAAIRLKIILARDQKWLMEQWAGNQAAALKRRDAAMQKALDSTGDDTPAANKVAAALWNEVCREVERVLAWNSLTWDGEKLAGDLLALAGDDAAKTLKEHGAQLEERAVRLEKDYEASKTAGVQELIDCWNKQSFKARIELSDANPPKDQKVTAGAVLTQGRVPDGAAWQWTASGGLTLQASTGPRVDLLAKADGTLTAQLVKDGRTLAKADVSLKIKPETVPPPEPSKKGKIEVSVSPAEVMATEPFTATAKLPADLAPKAKSFAWSSEAELVKPGLDSMRTAGPEAVMRFGPTVGRSGPAGAFNPNQSVRVSVLDADGKEIGRGEAAIKLKPVGLSASAAGSWEATTDAAGLHLQRKVAAKKGRCGDKDCVAQVWARLDVTWSSNTPKDDAELKKMVDSISWGYIRTQYHQVTPGKAESIMVAGFPGSFVNKTPQSYVQGNPEGLVDLAFPAVTAFAGGIVVKDRVGINFTGSVWGGGTRLGEGGNFWYDDSMFVSRQGSAAYAEMMAVLKSVVLGPDSKVTLLPYKGPALDGSDLPKVTLKAARTNVRVGDTVAVDAVVENAALEDNPLTFTWTGDHSGKGNQVLFLAAAGGKQTLSVAVSGAQGVMGSASLAFEVEEVKVQLTKIEPAANDIPVGGKALFQATVSAAGGAFTYRWQPSTEVSFTPAEGPEQRTSAVFKRPGRVRVWVDVLKKEGAGLSTVARSENLELNIIEPKLNLSAQPNTPMVGGSVKVSVASASSLADMDFFWDLAGNGKILRQSPEAREMTFLVLNDKPVTITVRARAKFTGDNLGEAKIAVTAQAFSVTVKNLGPLGPAPRIWKGGTLVDAAGQIAVFQNVRLQAAVTPAPAALPLRYRWTINDDSHFAGGTSGETVTVNRSQVGDCNAAVEVVDANGAVLGKGAGAFSVTISQKDLESSGNKAEAVRKLAAARQIWAKGDIDGAIKELEEAQRLDPTNAEIQAVLQKMKSDKSAILALHQKVRDLIDQEKFSQAANELGTAQGLNPNYKATRDLEAVLNPKAAAYKTAVLESFGRIEHLQSGREYELALAEIEATRKKFKYLDSFYIDRAAQYENFCKPFVAEKKNRLAQYTEARRLALNYDFEGANRIMEKTTNQVGNYFGTSDAEIAIKIINFGADVNQKVKHLGELMAFVGQGVEAAKGENPLKGLLENALKTAQEVLTIQPPNQKAVEAKDILSRRLAELNTAEGDALAAAGNLAGALGKYQEANQLVPTPQREAKIADIRRRMTPSNNNTGNTGGTNGVTGKFYVVDLTPYGGKKGTPFTLKDILVDAISWLRLKHHGEDGYAPPKMQLSISVSSVAGVTAVAVVGHLDHAYLVPQGTTITKMTVLAAEGSVTFDIKAGVHMSEWGAPLKHQVAPNAVDGSYLPVFTLPGPRTVTGIRFDYVELPKEYDQGSDAPGFCLRGITLVTGGQTSGQAPTASPTVVQSGNTGGVNDILGSVWQESENNFSGVWTRRGTSDVFDAVWDTNGRPVTAVLTMTRTGSDTVSIYRKDTSGSLEVDYTGTIGRDGSVTGSGKLRSNGFAFNWTARIQGNTERPVSQVKIPPTVFPELGRVWSVTEPQGWVGTWTRRGDTNIFDAAWTNNNFAGSGSPDEITVESFAGNRVVLYRRGMNGRYSGTLSADRKSVTGTASWYQAGWIWTAQIK